MQFTDGFIVLSSFAFEGERKQADDQSFQNEFSSGLHIDFNTGSTVSEMDFEIPQGTYTSIVFSFETFDENDTSAIYVSGVYTNNAGDKIPIIFDFWDGEYFSISAESEDGNSEIILDTDVPISTLIELDPVIWFSGISKSSLDSAELVEISGVLSIYISGKYNSDIYELVADELDKSTEAVFTVK
ncbi:MAG: hypothetical protein JKY53_09295 [Flavobacteriales bacterium]|nr:hypothetical protein [Flavobacteriales bacterium]